MQVGVSPKVKIPAIALFVVGVAFIIVGSYTGDKTYTEIGGTLIAAGGGQFALGHRAPVGEVAVDIGQLSDDLLTPEVQTKLEALVTEGAKKTTKRKPKKQ